MTDLTPAQREGERATSLRIAYADPPYPGQSARHYADHPDYDGEVDHGALITRLESDYPDGWALSTTSGALSWLLPLCPEKHRVLAWCKPFAAWKRGVYPAYAWEPVIMVGGRPSYGTRQTPRDWLSESMTTQKGTHGAKPLAFCYWLFACLGAEPQDDLVDLFPGSGAVSAAWESYCAQIPTAFPSGPEKVALFP